MIVHLGFLWNTTSYDSEYFEIVKFVRVCEY
jgi:hypothetical protein